MAHTNTYFKSFHTVKANPSSASLVCTRKSYVIIQIAKRGLAMRKTEGFIIGATLLALVLISSNIGLACGTKPAQTPTEQQPVSPAASLSPEVPQLPEET